MKDGKPTIDDVAALSRVARVTVSRVLNDQPNVSASVRKRVEAAIEQLGYSVNVQARNLAKGSSRTVLLIFMQNYESEPNSYYHSAVEVGALRGVASLGFEVVSHSLTECSDKSDAQIAQLVAQTQSIGVVLTPPFSDRPALIEMLQENGQAVVCISPGNGVHSSLTVSSVGMDDEAAGYSMASHLLELGHRRFGYIAGHVDHLSAERRLDGTRRALAENRLDQSALAVARGDFTFKAGVDLAPGLLTRNPSPTAIICANDDMAVGALFAAHRQQLRIPQDLSICGFDDTPISGLVWPPLTTIHQPIRDMSERATRLIVGTRDADGDASKIILPFSLMIRGSTGSPPN